VDLSTGVSNEIEYASVNGKDEWAKKIQLANILPRLEYETVKHGLRPCGLLFGVDPVQLNRLTSEYAKDGLILEPIARMAVAAEGFSHFMTPPNQNDAYRLKCVIARRQRDVNRFVAADSKSDDADVGHLLGYPKCCSRFFQKVWRQGCFDPIWETAENTEGDVVRLREVCRDVYGNDVERRIVLVSHREACKISSCLRYIGVRITSHFACAMNCGKSIAIANQRIRLARHLVMIGVNAAVEILQLPCRWECHQGLAVVSTPVFRFSVSSMPYAVKHVVQQEGVGLQPQ